MKKEAIYNSHEKLKNFKYLIRLHICIYIQKIFNAENKMYLNNLY